MGDINISWRFLFISECFVRSSIVFRDWQVLEIACMTSSILKWLSIQMLYTMKYSWLIITQCKRQIEEITQ